MNTRRTSLISFLAAALLMLSTQASATKIQFFVTGEAPGVVGEVIFDVIADPTVAGSAVIGIPVSDPRGLDGIGLLPGTVSEVVVGARDGPPSIAHFNVVTGATLADFVVNTDLVAGAGAGTTRPSSVFPTPTHVYYTENQFGFAGVGDLHRIMRVERASGIVEEVFDGSDAGDLENFEGLAIVEGRLHFFAADPTSSGPASRAFFSIGLDGAGLWDLAAPTELLGDLAAAVPPGDGSDELTFEPGVSVLGGGAGTIFGSNIINGEVIFWDVGLGAGGFFVDGFDIFLSDLIGGDLGSLLREIDGIRTDGLGHLIYAGRGGVLGAIDIAGVLLDGADDGDITILHDSILSGSGFVFDDLTQIRMAPEPGTLVLLMSGALMGFSVRCRKNGFA